MKRHMIIVSAIFFLVCFGLLSGMALAQHGLQAEINKQQQRINQGISSGSLTRAEADTLNDNLRYIQDTYNRAKADGTLTPNEEKRLRKMLDDNSQQIYNKKHNLPVRKLY
jgi:hypothetical protein